MAKVQRMVERVCVKCGFSMHGTKSEFIHSIECPKCKSHSMFRTQKEAEKEKHKRRKHEENRIAWERVEAAWKEAFEKFLSDLEIHYSDVSFSDTNPPPLRQFAFAVILGIDVKKGATEAWLSDKISDVLDDDDRDEYPYELDELEKNERVIAIYRKCTGTTGAHLLITFAVIIGGIILYLADL